MSSGKDGADCTETRWLRLQPLLRRGLLSDMIMQEKHILATGLLNRKKIVDLFHQCTGLYQVICFFYVDTQIAIAVEKRDLFA